VEEDDSAMATWRRSFGHELMIKSEIHVIHHWNQP
jgi:hypothetical protein